MALTIKTKENCRWDLVALGEVMLRLDPGDRRVATARSFEVYEGGGEYNVARGLRRCFGLDTAIVTAFADNPVGRLLQDLIYQGGVDQSLVRWVASDGVGRTVRNGLNFTERGFGVRAALDPPQLADAIRKAVAAVDPTIPPYQVRKLEQVVSSDLSPQKFLAGFLTIFAGIASCLAAIGLYGVVSYAASRRTKEIGIRIALGANRWSILRALGGRYLVVSGIGLAAGAGGSLLAASLIQHFLYRIEPFDPDTLGGVAILLILVAAVFAVAFVYSSVGHGGATGYLAVLALLGVAPASARVAVLVANVLVAGVAWWRFGRAGHFDGRVLLAFAVVSMPAAWFGSKVHISPSAFKLVLGSVLAGAGLVLLLRARQQTDGVALREFFLPLALLIGAVLGFLAGLTGIGGGVLSS